MTDKIRSDLGRASDMTIPGRRGFLATLTAMGTANFAGIPIPMAVAKKKRRRCKNKKKKCPPAFATCDDISCDPIRKFCYDRNAAIPLCGDTLNLPGPCAPCKTDNDCLGTNYKYCVAARTTLATGEITEFACPGMPRGVCGRPDPC